jgi:hypothetical protein
MHGKDLFCRALFLRKHKMNKIMFTASLWLILAGRIFSQAGISIDVERGSSSNVFSNYRQLPDSYTALEGQLNYDWKFASSALRVFYRPDITLFDTYSYRSYNTHRLGTAFYAALNRKGDKVTACADAYSRQHSEEYQWFEYRQLVAYVGIRLSLAEQLIAYSGISTNFRYYTQLAPFSHRVDQFYLRFSKFFNSGTTIILEADVLQKQYTLNDAVQLPAEFPNVFTEGQGSNRQAVGLLKLAQSVTPNMGISSQFLLRRNMANSVRYLVSTEGDYYSDEDLFDDVFGYNAEQANLSLKYHLFWKMTSELSVNINNKRYINRYALDLDGYPFDDLSLRHDLRQVYSLSFSKSLRYAKSIAPLIFSVNYTAIQNHSNDPYYKYQTRYLSLSLSQEF